MLSNGEIEESGKRKSLQWFLFSITVTVNPRELVSLIWSPMMLLNSDIHIWCSQVQWFHYSKNWKGKAFSKACWQHNQSTLLILALGSFCSTIFWHYLIPPQSQLSYDKAEFIAFRVHTIWVEFSASTVNMSQVKLAKHRFTFRIYMNIDSQIAQRPLQALLFLACPNPLALPMLQEQIAQPSHRITQMQSLFTG